MKILESAASKTSSSVVLSARQIDEAWRKYLDSTKNHATKDMAQISTVAQKEAGKVKGTFRSLWENLGKVVSSREVRKVREVFSNVAIVGMLPVPMLPVSNWVLVLAIGNTFTLATLSISGHGKLLYTMFAE